MGAARLSSGFIQNYDVSNFRDGKIWKTVSQGKEFCQYCPNNPIPRKFEFDSVELNLFVFESDSKTTDGNSVLSLELRYSDTLIITITYLIIPICSYFSPKLWRSKTNIIVILRGRYWGYGDFGNQRFHSHNSDNPSRQIGDGGYAMDPFLFRSLCLHAVAMD